MIRYDLRVLIRCHIWKVVITYVCLPVTESFHYMNDYILTLALK